MPLFLLAGCVRFFQSREKANLWFQGGLGGVAIPPHVFILGNVPHDWLFDNERVSAVVHHGGAGTTAVGLAKGRPTVVVPFFGDQGFWGTSCCLPSLPCSL